MSRREITFFGMRNLSLLQQIDGMSYAGRSALRELFNSDQVATQRIRMEDGTERYTVDFDMYAIRRGAEDEDYRRFEEDDLEQLERNIYALIETVGTDFGVDEAPSNLTPGRGAEYRTIFIDLDPLPWVRDVKTTNDYLKSVDATGQIVEITPVYNYYAGKYQQFSSQVNERLLPSIYDNEICRILQERDNDSYLGSPLVLANARSKCNDLLPQTLEDWEDYGSLLADINEGNQVVQSKSVTVFPQSEIVEILNLHKKKNLYPMYVDITFPTAQTGPFMKAIKQANLSTTLFDGLINYMTREGVNPYVIVGRSNNLVMDDEEGKVVNKSISINQRRPSSYEQGTSVQVTPVDDIIQGILERARSGEIDVAVNADFLSLRGNERNPASEEGSCLSLLDRVYMQAVVDRVDSIIQNSSSPHLVDRIDASQPLNQWNIQTAAGSSLKDAFGQEIIAYSVEKSGQDGLLSTHIFPNSDDLGVLKYIDTQVKYDTEYQYEVYAHVLTTSEHGVVNVSGRRGRWPQQRQQAGRYPQLTQIGITTEYRKGLVLVKVPIASTAITGETAPSPYQLAPVVGGSFPVVKILDRPPIPPNVTFIPFKGVKNKILIKMERQTDELTGQRTVPFIPILDDDASRFNERAEYQRIENFDLPDGHVEFKAEGEDTIAVQVFRTTKEPEHSIDPEEGTVLDEKKSAYLNFRDNFYKQVTTDSGLAFTDTIAPNTKYYYTFRSVDINGNYSNPTAIMQVEIVETEGVTYPLIREYIPDRTEPDKQDSRNMTRFIQVRPSFLQSEPLPDDNNALMYGQRLTETVFGKHYKIRITSLDTGRQFDINCTFNNIETNEEEE